jgi:hypothetical protein
MEQTMTVCYAAPRNPEMKGHPMLGVGEMLRMLRDSARLSALAGLVLMLGAAAAAAFDYGSYQPADLDQLARRKPQLGLGADIPNVQSVRLEVTLAEQADECPTKYLKWAMKKAGIAKDAVQSTPVTHCITVKSEKGRQYPLFIQDAVVASLAKDVKPGGKLTVYGSLVYFAARGPGIVVNEYSTEQATTPQPHSGVDLSASSKKK